MSTSTLRKIGFGKAEKGPPEDLKISAPLVEGPDGDTAKKGLARYKLQFLPLAGQCGEFNSSGRVPPTTARAEFKASQPAANLPEESDRQALLELVLQLGHFCRKWRRLGHRPPRSRLYSCAVSKKTTQK